MTQQEAQKRRAEISRTMSRLAQRDTLNDNDKLEFDRLEREFRDLRPIADDPTRSSVRPPNGPIGGDHEYRASSEVWVDRQGREARVLSPTESVRAALPAGTPTPEVSLGAYLRSMATGPRNDAERRALAEGTDSAGGFTVPQLLATELIDRLRPQAVTFRAGAKTVVLPSHIYTIARLRDDPTAMWRAENGVIPDTDPVFEGVIFKAKAMGCLVKVSMELLEDSSNINEVLPGVFAKVAALELDRVALVGLGETTSPVTQEPLGIAYTGGVGSHRLDAHISSYDCILDAVDDLAQANAAFPTASIMHPSVNTEFSKLKDQLTQPLRRPDAIKDLPFLVTTQLPTNESGGSPSGTDCSRIITGDFSQLLIGMRTEARVLTLKERFVDYGQFAFMLWMRADVQLAHAKSFSQTLGVM
jgi:HK97 family phage major capsid protein